MPFLSHNQERQKHRRMNLSNLYLNLFFLPAPLYCACICLGQLRWAGGILHIPRLPNRCTRRKWRGDPQKDRDHQRLHEMIEIPNQEYMALINPCENTTVQYLCSTSLTVRLRNVGHDSEVQQMTRRVRSVVPSTHSTSPIYSSCHQPGSPPPLCSASCHPDSHAQASEIIRSHRPLGLRWGPFTCPQCWHRRPAKGVETTSRLSSSNMAAHRRERPQTTESGAVVGPAQSLWPGSVAWNRRNSDAPAGACYMMMMIIIIVPPSHHLLCTNLNLPLPCLHLQCSPVFTSFLALIFYKVV